MLADQPGRLLEGGDGLLAIAAVDEQVAREAIEPAEQRDVSDLLLGDAAVRPYGTDA